MTEILRLKSDKRLRDRLFVAEAMSHPAKGHIGLWEAILDRYTKPGDWVLDPMAGIGTTLLAALMGRNVCCVELEPHFVEPMRRSWLKMRQNGPMLGCEMGQAMIIRGDARCLPLGSADHIVTSPPFGGEEQHTGGETTTWAKHYGYQQHNTGYTRPSAIVTSPPYEGSLSLEQSGIDKAKLQHPYGPNSQLARPQSYTRPVDAVVSSPPYEGFTKNLNDIDSWDEAKGGRIKEMQQLSVSMPKPYSHDVTNIGNLRGEAYWDSMRLCYSECHRVLRPSGVMVLVLKGFTRDGKYVDLPAQTAELVESLGFRQFDHWKRELWSLSFWRILQKRRDPAAFDDRLNYEEVLAFRKDGDGGGIDSVISSPPYEGSFAETDTLERSAENVRQGKNVGLRPDVYTSEGNIAAKGYFKGYTRKGKP